MLTTNSVWIRSHLLFDNLIFATRQAKARRAGPGRQPSRRGQGISARTPQAKGR